jgi:hypothetical protein
VPVNEGLIMVGGAGPDPLYPTSFETAAMRANSELWSSRLSLAILTARSHSSGEYRVCPDMEPSCLSEDSRSTFPSRQASARAVPDTGVRALRTMDLDCERTRHQSPTIRRWCDRSGSPTCQIPGQPSNFDLTSASIVDSGTRSPSALASGIALRP